MINEMKKDLSSTSTLGSSIMPKSTFAQLMISLIKIIVDKIINDKMNHVIKVIKYIIKR